MQVEGIATVLGDDVDTDTIFPGRYLADLGVAAARGGAQSERLSR